jgi:hypothetical protein
MVVGPSSYDYALACEQQANASTSQMEKLVQYLEGATAIAPKKPGLYDDNEKGQVKEFIKCAELWERVGDLFNPSLTSDASGNGSESNARFESASVWYSNAAYALLTANLHKKEEEEQYVWNEYDDRIDQLFQKALSAIQGVQASTLSPKEQLSLKEHQLKILRSSLSHPKEGQEEVHLKLRKEVVNKEIELYGFYTQVAQSSEEKDWKLEVKRALHLKRASLQIEDPKSQEELLVQAEAIAQEIWTNWPDCQLDLEFSPHVKTSPGDPKYTLLGEIQEELLNCRTLPSIPTR